MRSLATRSSSPTPTAQKKKAPRPGAEKKTSSRKRAAPRRAKPKVSTEVMFEKIAFTLLPIEDPERARSFYEETLGLTRGLASPDGTWTEYDLPGGGCVALFRHPDPSMRGKPGGSGLAFEVADLDALNRRLMAEGVTYMGGIVQGPRCRMSNVRDSEGNHLILHQLAKKTKAKR